MTPVYEWKEGTRVALIKPKNLSESAPYGLEGEIVEYRSLPNGVFATILTKAEGNLARIYCRIEDLMETFQEVTLFNELRETRRRLAVLEQQLEAMQDLIKKGTE